MIEVWPVEMLRQHPHQDALHKPLSEAELGRLAASMEAEGQKEAAEVHPNGTTLDGHQRLRAAKRLGWATIRVRVRRDLAGDERAANRRHAEANLIRRQLGPLDQARLAKRLMEIAENKPLDGLPVRMNGDLRDRVGAVINRSGRQVTRLLNVLKTPMSVQRAVAAGELTLVLAERVSFLGPDAQRRIAREIEGGAEAAAVVAANRPSAGPAEVDVDKEMANLFRAGSRALETIGGREKEVGLPPFHVDSAECINKLKRVEKMISRIVERLEAGRKELARSARAIGRLASRPRVDSWD